MWEEGVVKGVVKDNKLRNYFYETVECDGRHGTVKVVIQTQKKV